MWPLQVTTYEMEVVGIILAMWIIRNIPSSSHTMISLYTDSQAFLRSITKCATGPSHYLVEAFHSADKLPNYLWLKWISGHSEVKGNERADELAKSATQGLSSPPMDLPPLLHQPLPHSATAEKQAYTSEINLMRLDQW
jgi:ribonuclease HI